MYTYRLHYIDLNYQNRKIITLDRFDELHNTVVRIRASEQQLPYHEGFDHFIDFISADVKQMTDIPATADKECYYCESMLGSTKTNPETEQLYSDVFNLITHTIQPYPEIIRTMFIGDIVSLCDGLNGQCANITITNPSDEQKQIIDRIVDTAVTIYQNMTSYSSETIYHDYIYHQ